jgi:multidrug resistance efflux pump
VAERDDVEIILNDLLRLRNDPQEAQIKVAEAEAGHQTALAQVKQAEANLVALSVDRTQHTLVAHLAGWVVEKVAHEGEMAVPGATLLTLADLTDLILTVYIPEPDVDLVSIGQKVEVFVDSFPGEPFTGYITFISDEAEFTPKNIQTKEERVNTVFAIKIKLENEDQRLKPGMPADAILAEGPRL